MNVSVGNKYRLEGWEENWWIECLYIDPKEMYWLGKGNNDLPALINFSANWERY